MSATAIQPLRKGGWLTLTEPVGPAPLCEVLETNGRLRPGVRYALSAGGKLQVYAEKFGVGGESDAEAQLAGDFEEREAAPAENSDAELPTEVTEMIEGSGWTCHGRSGGLAVDLESGRCPSQASVTARGDGSILLRAEVVRMDGTEDEATAEAIAFLLLATSGRLRLVRGYAHDGAAGFEVALAPASSSQPEIETALAALSIACQEAGEEANALQSSPGLARRYLALRSAGRDTGFSTANPNREPKPQTT